MDPSAVYIFLLTIVSSFIQRTVGFGFGIFIMTMLPLLMPSYGEATTLSGLLALTTSATVTWKVRRDIRWHKLLPILATFSVVAIASVFCLKQMDDRLLRHILGVVLIITAIWFSFFSRRIHIPATPALYVRNGNAQRHDGRILRHAGTARGALFPLLDEEQGGIHGAGAALYPLRQHHHDRRTRIQRLPHTHGGDRLLLRHRRRAHRRTARLVCLQAHSTRISSMSSMPTSAYRGSYSS